MTLRWALAALHLIALGLGLGAVWARGRSLRSQLQAEDLQRVFRSDALWGVAAALWVGTGLWRLLAGLEKPTGYYLQNHMFLTKMGLFVLLLVLEVSPMVTLMRWRRIMAAGQSLDTGPARRMANISFIQAGILILMVFTAAAMARGIG